MRILFTGASSFTGCSFVSELSKAGHEVTATFQGTPDSYSGSRLERVAQVTPHVVPAWSTEFGSDRFIALLEQPWDLFCHHAAETEMQSYRSPDFDTLRASARNTRSLRRVMETLAKGDCRRIVLTGTVFEPYEGASDGEPRALSLYGLSKHISFELFRFEAQPLGLSLGKFVIPNPFGPQEEPTRFTSYLVREWSEGRIPTLRTPDYVRDNIHVSLLALAYRRFCETLSDSAGVKKCDPSGYRETQGAFAERFARELGNRLGREFKIDKQRQVEFSEPMVRTNLTPATEIAPEWCEVKAWDEWADRYKRLDAG